MKVVDIIARLFVGLLFIFSGSIKINDPQGTAIKLEEYFDVFATDIASFFHYLVPASLVLGVFVIVLEIMLGIALLVNYRIKITSWILMLLIVFFTFLTGYSAIFDKVTDCGCFGEVIPLKPMESFIKDLMLLVWIGYIFFRKQRLTRILPEVKWMKGRNGDISMVVVFLLNVFIAYYSIQHLPYIDFRPYKVGANIQQSMQPSEPYRYKYIMEKDGQEYEFDKYPSDTTYTFKEMVMLNPEAQPKITDYNIWNEEGDFTDQSFEGERLLIIYSDVEKSNPDNVKKMMELVRELGSDVESWVITANDERTYENFRHEYQIPLPYFYADGTVIKAMIRANPGIMILKDGTVLGKWHNNDIPGADAVRKLFSQAG